MVYLYSVFDKLRESTLCSFTAPNDGMAIRDNARGLSQVCPLGDLELRCVGELDDKSGFVSLSYLVTDEKYHVVSWDSYKFPESPIKK